MFGCVISISEGFLNGWAFNPYEADRNPVLVRAVLRDRVVCSGLADIFTPQFAEWWDGDRKIGFRIPLPSAIDPSDLPLLQVWAEATRLPWGQEPFADNQRFLELTQNVAQKEILIAGHSHSICMTNHWNENEIGVANVRGSKTCHVLFGPVPRSEDYWQEAIKSAKERLLFISWEGNEHNGRFFFEPTPQFDFISSRFPDLPVDQSNLVPEEMVRAFFSYSIDTLRNLIRDAKAAGAVQVLIIGGPPPKRNELRMRKILIENVETSFIQFLSALEASPKDVKFTNPFVRLKLWAVLQDLREELAQSEGCHYVGPPLTTLDEYGFLKEEFWAYDLTHANFEYGDRALCEAISYSQQMMFDNSK